MKTDAWSRRVAAIDAAGELQQLAAGALRDSTTLARFARKLLTTPEDSGRILGWMRTYLVKNDYRLDAVTAILEGLEAHEPARLARQRAKLRRRDHEDTLRREDKKRGDELLPAPAWGFYADHPVCRKSPPDRTTREKRADDYRGEVEYVVGALARALERIAAGGRGAFDLDRVLARLVAEGVLDMRALHDALGYGRGHDRQTAEQAREFLAALERPANVIPLPIGGGEGAS